MDPVCLKKDILRIYLMKKKYPQTLTQKTGLTNFRTPSSFTKIRQTFFRYRVFKNQRSFSMKNSFWPI